MQDDLDFGDYCKIEQFRYGVDNEMFLYKVIASFRSNHYVDVPVKFEKNTLHNETVDIVSCICCGVDETTVVKFRVCDVTKLEKEPKSNG